VQTATIEEVQSRLPELLAALSPGEKLIVTRDDQPVATLRSALPWGVPIFGRGKGTLVVISEDDEHLNDFAEYMP